MKIILSLLLLTSFVFANNCKYTFEDEDIEAHWIAFKTEKKAPVKGRFKDLGLTKEEFEGKTLEGIFTDFPFKINTRSTWTRNTGRDAKIVMYFFSGLNDNYTISGKVSKFTKDSLNLDIKMNGINKTIPMKVQLKESYFLATGSIDVLDFSLSKSLKAINKACHALHKGKIWSDVNLELKVNFEKDCD